MQRVFKSRHHPEGRSRGLVYTEALAKPIGACVAPLMIGATVAALQEQPVWGYLVWGLPTALVLATVWTHFRLSSLPAEIHFRAGQVAIQSIQDVLRGASLDWHPLNNVQVSPGELEISVGWSTEVCRPRDWPHYRQLRDSAQHAFRPHTPSPASE